jgi:hypothetical protein
MRRIGSDNLARIIAVVGLCCLALVYGVLARQWGWFPAPYVSKAQSAGRAAYRVLFPEDDIAVPARDARAGVTVQAPGSWGELTFFTGYQKDGFEARLIDLDGKVLHRWKTTHRAAWPELPPHLVWRDEETDIVSHGAHLFPDGDILLNFQGGFFPYGGGMVRLDKDGKIVWKLASNTHHDIHVDDQGFIWAPSLVYRSAPPSGFERMKPHFYEDTLLKIEPETGEVIKEISILSTLRDMQGIFPRQEGKSQDDPTHLNNIDILPAAWADRFPMFKAGDILVSPRNLNAVVVIDRASETAKWVLSGPFYQQHDPDFLPNGNIAVFDNRGGDPACGGSRILEIEPTTQQIVWQYDGCGGAPFFTFGRGEQQLLPNGNVLIAESEGGRLLEVTHEPRPRVVWDYVNALGEIDGVRKVGIVTHAARYRPEELGFLNELTSSR